MKIKVNDKEFNFGYMNAKQECDLVDFIVALQAELAKEMSKKDNPTDIKKGDQYFYTGSTGEVRPTTHVDSLADRLLLKEGNAYSNKSLAEMCAAQETLTRLMRQYSLAHDGIELLSKYNWSDKNRTKCYISYRHDDNNWHVFACSFTHDPEKVYFMSREIVRACIRDVVIPFCKEHPELGYKC